MVSTLVADPSSTGLGWGRNTGIETCVGLMMGETARMKCLEKTQS